jgi:hypothetical protein
VFVLCSASKKIQKFFKMVIAWSRFDRAVAEKNARIAAEKRLALETKAVNLIGWYFKRHREKGTLAVRFDLRKKMLDTYKALDAAKVEAYGKRDAAYEEVRITEESLAATIAASWRQGSDANGRNYYYNHVTGDELQFGATYHIYVFPDRGVSVGSAGELANENCRSMDKKC